MMKRSLTVADAMMIEHAIRDLTGTVLAEGQRPRFTGNLTAIRTVLGSVLVKSTGDQLTTRKFRNQRMS